MLLHSTWLATFALSVAAAATPKARRSDTDRVSTTWYAGWHSEDFPLCEVSWEKYTHVTYAFAVTTPDVHTLSLEGSNGSLLPEFVQTAHEYGTKALISVGGWTGSRFFSTAVASAENRTAFVNTVLDFVKKYDLDGVDFDWEYPAAAGIGCNTFSSNDTANFLSFLQELRATETGKNMIVTAAASISPLIGANGSPSTDLSGFAEVFDWISIMNYDVWGSWMPAVGPNAPLQDACAAKPSEKAGSLASAVDAWHNAGIPFSQLVAAVPAYGHGYRVRKADAFASSNSSSNGQQALTLYPPFVASERPAGDAWSGAAGTDVCGAATPAGDTWTFWGLIEAGWLNAAGEPAEGISSAWDDCAKVPYVYNVTSEVMISYDDPRSFAAKGQFVREKNLRGFSMWEAAGDYDDMLLDAMLTAIGDFDL